MKKASRKAAGTSHTRKPQRPAGRGIPFGLLFVFVCAILFAFHAHAFRFTQDDAYISMRYAKNLVEGRGLVFNPGERVEGYTNFAWTLFLRSSTNGDYPSKRPPRSAAPRLAWHRFSSRRFAKALEERWGPAAMCTAALVAGCLALAHWVTGGLETGMFTFLITAGFERALAPNVSVRPAGGGPDLLPARSVDRSEFHPRQARTLPDRGDPRGPPACDFGFAPIAQAGDRPLNLC